MGDVTTLVKARRELEELYLGVPDDSVNLTFKDLANIQQNGVTEKKTVNMEPIRENGSVDLKGRSELNKLPSLDFNTGLQAVRTQRHVEAEIHRENTTPNSSRRNKGMRNMVEGSLVYDDASIMSNMSMMSITSRSPFDERGGRRRPGIPHTNICTICSIYIYIFRHRCLVCGRVYCRQCVTMGMGEMAEGRKCIQCLGKRFSQRYIKRAGKVGCCAGYSSQVKQQELKWAEKGPRKSGERSRYGRCGMVSRSRSPVMPGGNATRAHVSRSPPPSFVANSSHSPANHHHMVPY